MSIVSNATVVMLCLASLLPSSHGQTEEEPQCLKCENIARSAAPKYRVARKTRLTTGSLKVHISIHKDQFTTAALSALACRLARDFHNDDVLVLIFDDFDSARRYVTPWVEEKPPNWKKYARSWRATYSREAQKHEHWIRWDINPEKTREEKIDICPPAPK